MTRRTITDVADEITRITLGEADRNGISALLKSITKLTNSFGCALWRETENSASESPQKLKLLANYFKPKGSYFGVNIIELKGSFAGRILSGDGKYAIENDLHTGNYRSYGRPFIIEHEIDRVAGTAFRYKSGRRGVLTIYRRKQDPPYITEDIVPIIEKIASLVPLLYHAARQSAGYELIRTVTEITKKYASPQSSSKSQEQAKKNAFKEISRALDGTFHAVENSIFTESPDEPNVFTCAFTSNGPHKTAIQTRKYRAALDDGFSALCLYSRKPIRVHDVQNPEHEVAEYQKEYLGFEGHSPKGVSDAVNKFLGNPNPPPPHSLIVVPLLGGDKLLGFIRCWVAKTGPTYFSSDDIKLLTEAAKHIAQLIGVWEERDRQTKLSAEQSRMFREIADTHYAVGADAAMSDIFVAALKSIRRFIPAATANTVRLRDQKTDEFYFYAFPRSTDREAAKRRFPSRGTSLAAQVVRKYAAIHFRNLSFEGSHEIFRGIQEMVIAPIVVGGIVEGLLDLRTETAGAFSGQTVQQAESICQILGLQMGLKQQQEKAQNADLAKEVEMRNAALEREKTAKSEAAAAVTIRDAFQDMFHKLKSPISEAARQIENTLERTGPSPIRDSLESVSSLLMRAELTTKLLGLFAQFSRNAPVHIRGIPQNGMDLLRLATRVERLETPRISGERNIQIRVDADSFISKARPIRFDPELLIHALTNIVDNAVKYSFRNSRIEIFHGPGFLAVKNRGLRISPHEVNLMKVRNWRSTEAKLVTGEGNGLGLWIADRIMLSHGGQLDIFPTTKDGITEVRLVFRK